MLGKRFNRGERRFRPLSLLKHSVLPSSLLDTAQVFSAQLYRGEGGGEEDRIGLSMGITWKQFEEVHVSSNFL